MFSYKYMLGPAIGSGSYGTVYQASRKLQDGTLSSTKYACKIISTYKKEAKKNLNYQKLVYNETQSLQRLSGLPHIIRFFDFLQDEDNYYIVTEYVDGGTLESDEIMSEDKAAGYISQVVDGIYQCHKNEVVHGDIKPSNLLIKDDYIKLCDFGSSTYCTQFHGLFQKRGTVYYLAPEVLSDVEFGYSIDMWSVGIMLYLMLFGEHPILHKSMDIELSKKLIQTMPISITKSSISKECYDFINLLLSKDPRKRITAADALHHPYLKRNGV